MALFQEGPPTGSAMETSNFAHVVFLDVGKSFLPNAPLECRYTLTPFISPHHRDWIGIFKVGWSTARDYYTFQWSPRSVAPADGGVAHQAVLFQGYYLPKDDGEFYQFCYVTHSGEVRGASTPFQFRAATPPSDELLTIEDDGNSEILVVTSKTHLLQQRVEEAQRERVELREALRLLQQEKEELWQKQERLRREREEERETCTRLRTQNQELQRSSQTLQEEKEEAQRRHEEAAARLRQLEADLLGLTQRALQKETEMDCLRDRMKKLNLENDSLESQLKMERDERELCKIHLKNTELENTKLSAEVQMLRSVDMNKEISLTQFQDQLSRLRAERDKLQRDSHACAGLPGENVRLKEQLRQTEEQLQALRQEAAMLGAELRDTASARDQTMSELYRARLEADALRANLADAQAQCSRMEEELENLRTAGQQEPGVAAGKEAELQEEVEELRLRLQMAAEHYKEKYRECHRLRKQLSLLQEESKKSAAEETADTSEAATETQSSVDSTTEEKPQDPDKHAENKDEDQNLPELSEEDEEEEVEGEEPEGVALQDDPAHVQTETETETEREEWQVLQEGGGGEAEQGSRSEGGTPMFLQYPIPYLQCPAELEFGNPYSMPTAPPQTPTPDGADSEISLDGIARPPPSGPQSWDSAVVCIQPSRAPNPPDGLEDPEERSDGDDGEQPADCHPHTPLQNNRASFCFDSSEDQQKRCPLCEVVFPPQYEQRRFEEHVESHWRVCPVCSQQFPLDCQQQLYETHVNTHFDGNVLNFD